MPNCDFYSNIEDPKIILNKLFEENECEIYELASEPEKSLKQFYNTEQVLNEFNRCYTNGKNGLQSIYNYTFQEVVLNLNLEK